MRFLILLLFSFNAVADWVFANPDIHIVASYAACEYPVLTAKGFEYKVEIGVPITNLKDVQDAYRIDDIYAITTVGCWSESKHKIYVYRKDDQDGYFDDNFRIDNTWKWQ